MRAKDFIKESDETRIPNSKSVGVAPAAEGPINFYYKYRLGVKMAGSPSNDHPYEKGGEYVDDMVMIGYSDADNEIIDKATQAFGYKQKSTPKKHNKEIDGTNTVSPVAKWK